MTPQKHTYFISLTSLYKYQARLCPMVNTPIYYNINTARHRSYFLWLVLKLQHQYRMSPFLLSVTCSQATTSIPHVTVPTFCDLFSRMPSLNKIELLNLFHVWTFNWENHLTSSYQVNILRSFLFGLMLMSHVDWCIAEIRS